MADFTADGVSIFATANGVTMRSYGYASPAGRNVYRVRPPAVSAPLQARFYPSIRPVTRSLAGLFTPRVFSILAYQGFSQSMSTNSRARGMKVMSDPQVLILRGSQENPLMGGSGGGGGGSTRPSSGLVYPRLVK